MLQMQNANLTAGRDLILFRKLAVVKSRSGIGTQLEAVNGNLFQLSIKGSSTFERNGWRCDSPGRAGQAGRTKAELAKLRSLNEDIEIDAVVPKMGESDVGRQQLECGEWKRISSRSQSARISSW